MTLCCILRSYSSKSQSTDNQRLSGNSEEAQVKLKEKERTCLFRSLSNHNKHMLK